MPPLTSLLEVLPSLEMVSLMRSFFLSSSLLTWVVTVQEMPEESAGVEAPEEVGVLLLVLLLLGMAIIWCWGRWCCGFRREAWCMG